ncbi:MAG: CRISPR-associated protein Csx18 [Synechococcus sp.]|nr:CRISPR-associated protein Csx18 [Synechococcus sp.]
MYLSARAIFIRNLAAALVNGAITLVILLIAPLGLAAVIMNTILVGVSTFLVCSMMDLVSAWLLGGAPPPQSLGASRRGDLIQRFRQQDIAPYRDRQDR